MQAIILAAGMGKRLKKLTADATKCMVKVNGVTLIERALSNLEKTRISRIVLVVGYQAQQLIDFVDSLNCTIPIVYVQNQIYNITNNIYSLYLARDYLLEEDTILLVSDLIFGENVLPRLLDDPYPNLALVAKYESWMDGTVVTLDDDGNITDFLNKAQFNFRHIDEYYKTVNIYKFSKEFSSSHYVPFLEAYCKALGNNEYYEQVLKVISLLEEPGIKASVLGNELWYEIDDIQDLDIAESLFTNTIEEKLQKMSQRYGGYWRYPKLIDFCYLVNPYYPPKRLLEEMAANFNRLITDYPSGQSINSLLAAKYFGVDETSIVVGNGAAELIKSLAGAIEGPVGVVLPTFEEYPQRLGDLPVVGFSPESPDFSYSAQDLIQFFASKALSTLIVINPDNPTGNLVHRAEMELLLKWTREQGITLIVDESFIDFATEGDQETLLHQEILDTNPHLVLVKSISKSYGVPGLRLGILASADKKLIGFMKKDLAIWNINSFAEFFLQIFEKYRDDYVSALQSFKEIRTQLLSDLREITFLRVIPSEANFIMCEVLQPNTAHEITARLLDQANIFIKDLSQKRGVGGEYIRVAVKLPHENDALVSALRTLTPTKE